MESERAVITPEEGAAAGAAWLDANGPEGWAARIDLERLSLRSPCHCVAGQVWGHFWDLVFFLRDEENPNEDQALRDRRQDAAEWLVRVGFQPDDTSGYEAWGDLQQAWLEEITRRTA